MDNSTSSPSTLSLRFKGEVLNKVYRIWLLRTLAPVVIAEIAALGIFLWQLGRWVFIQRVAENAMTALFLNPPQFFSFLVSAFTHASTAARLLSVGVVILAALLIRHFTQGILRFILVRQRYFERLQKPDYER